VQHQEQYIERERLLGRIKKLEAENAELRKRLGEDVMPIEKAPTFSEIFVVKGYGTKKSQNNSETLCGPARA
jgi:hypothetical protein